MEATTPAAAATVVVLCAAWCDTCHAFRSVFDRLADARRDARFIWLDIEDEAALVGDIDVENFPRSRCFVERYRCFSASACRTRR